MSKTEKHTETCNTCDNPTHDRSREWNNRKTHRCTGCGHTAYVCDNCGRLRNIFSIELYEGEISNLELELAASEARAESAEREADQIRRERDEAISERAEMADLLDARMTERERLRERVAEMEREIHWTCSECGNTDNHVEYDTCFKCHEDRTKPAPEWTDPECEGCESCGAGSEYIHERGYCTECGNGTATQDDECEKRGTYIDERVEVLELALESTERRLSALEQRDCCCSSPSLIKADEVEHAKKAHEVEDDNLLRDATPEEEEIEALKRTVIDARREAAALTAVIDDLKEEAKMREMKEHQKLTQP